MFCQSFLKQESGCATAQSAFDDAIAVARKGKSGGRYKCFI